MLNKYKELHEQLMDCVIEYHNIHTEWILRPTQARTGAIRKVLSEMRRLETEMRQVAQARMREVSANKKQKWNRTKENIDERNNSSN